MVTYNIDDKYCPQGHNWIFVPTSLLFGDCYYCRDCDKIYQPTVKELSKAWFEKNYCSDRFEDIKRLSFVLEARKKVSNADLIKLGYLEE